MVNNWAMELQQHTIEFEYIQGVKNTLADTMSRLVKITPDIEKRTRKTRSGNLEGSYLRR